MAIEPDTEGQKKFALSLVHDAMTTLRIDGELLWDDELRARRQIAWARRRASELGFTEAVEEAIRATRIKP